MRAEPVLLPDITSPPEVMVDVLELIAIFNEYNVSRVDEVRSSLFQQKDEQDSDISSNDREAEEINDKIENEINSRISSLGDSYPYEFSSDGEELTLVSNWKEEKYSFYITCLLTSHLTRDSSLNGETPIVLIQRLRNRVFQVMATLAMAGLARGNAASIGWPREGSESVMSALKRAERYRPSYITLDEPGELTPPREKDGGIDIIAWSMTDDRPPPTHFYYGQVASGHNWQDKPVELEVRMFEMNYFKYAPGCNRCYATLIPFRVMNSNSEWYRDHSKHGSILDRTRLPKYALEGINLAEKGVWMDESNNVSQITEWINNIIEYYSN
ncbi:hypothetical protein [Gluconobacter oxydans]|uniref:hypothetical protein n=1 Tax=Gluconobacter oxydans TaxID=442 RepID=UPI001559F808|nr:hypothetical protein [Gluconobacter oxydans]